MAYKLPLNIAWTFLGLGCDLAACNCLGGAKQETDPLQWRLDSSSRLLYPSYFFMRGIRYTRTKVTNTCFERPIPRTMQKYADHGSPGTEICPASWRLLHSHSPAARVPQRNTARPVRQLPQRGRLLCFARTSLHRSLVDRLTVVLPLAMALIKHLASQGRAATLSHDGLRYRTPTTLLPASWTHLIAPPYVPTVADHVASGY
jgi:hypothetical protein